MTKGGSYSWDCAGACGCAHCHELRRELDAALVERDKAQAQLRIVPYLDRVADLERERDDANERARLAVVRADIVQRERDEALARYDARHASAIHSHEVAERLRALLRELEWTMDDGCMYEWCPVCGADKDGPFKGHAPNCRLKAALEDRDA